MFDGVELEGDIMNFYTSGDVAPAGRFKYSYAVKADSAPGTVTAEDTKAPETSGNA